MKLEQLTEAQYSGKQDTLKVVAEQLESGMTGTGIFDDGDELLNQVQEESGDDAARRLAADWNICIDFINQVTNQNLGRYDKDWVEEILRR